MQCAVDDGMSRTPWITQVMQQQGRSRPLRHPQQPRASSGQARRLQQAARLLQGTQAPQMQRQQQLPHHRRGEAGGVRVSVVRLQQRQRHLLLLLLVAATCKLQLMLQQAALQAGGAGVVGEEGGR
jgi:hypothetical protein